MNRYLNIQRAWLYARQPLVVLYRYGVRGDPQGLIPWAQSFPASASQDEERRLVADDLQQPQLQQQPLHAKALAPRGIRHPHSHWVLFGRMKCRNHLRCLGHLQLLGFRKPRCMRRDAYTELQNNSKFKNN